MSTRRPLPHADAIAALRSELAMCQAAVRLDQHAYSVQIALSILRGGAAPGAAVLDELPGDEVLVDAVRSFPTLAELLAPSPRPADLQAQIATRAERVGLLRAALEPYVARNTEVAEELHALQHAQRHALEDPIWADEVAELVRLGAERDALSLQMAPLKHQSSQTEPVSEMLAGFRPQLRDELAGAAASPDPHGAVAWRAAIMARQQLVGLAQVIHQLGLTVSYPFEPMVPDQPALRHRERLVHEAAAVLRWMDELADALAAQSEHLRRQLDALEQEHRRVEAAITERMG